MLRLLVVSGLLLASLPVFAQPPYRVMTFPTPPRKEVLDRLSLTQAWHVKLPLERHRDGLFSVQILPHPNGPQLAVQSLSGKVFLLDGEKGDILWQNQPGIPFWSMQPVGYNSHSILTTRRDQLYILNRETGRQRLFSTDPIAKTVSFGMTLLAAPSAAPAGDEELAFFSMGNRLAAYRLPPYGLADQARKGVKGGVITKGTQVLDAEREELTVPEISWIYYLSDQTLANPPIFTDAQVGAVTTDGSFLSFNKFERLLRFDFKTRGHITAGLGQHGLTAYIASQDFAVYALDIANEKVYWRYLAGASLLRKPDVTDNDVFIHAERIGLFRLDRITGQEVWLNKQAYQFLANNHRFVYALDRQGNLLILDYARGSLLGQYEVRDWQVPVSNEWSDRVYLANHDGQIVCMHYRDNRFPARIKTMVDFKLKPLENPMKPREEPQEKAPDMMGQRNGFRFQPPAFPEQLLAVSEETPSPRLR